MKGEKEYMEEGDVSRVAVIEKELNGLKDDVNEIKALLTRLTEGILSEGKQEIEPKEPKEETGSSQQGRRQQSPQSKLNSKKGHGRLDRETLAQLCWNGPYSAHRASVSVDAFNISLETYSLLHKPLPKIKMEVFGDLQSTYELSRAYEGACDAEKRVPMLLHTLATIRRWTGGPQ